MIKRLVMFGATGDLAGRFLLPALAALRAAGALPDDLDVVGAARDEGDDDGFRRQAAERLHEHAASVPAAVREALVRSLRYRPVDVEDPDSLARALGDGRPDPSATPVAAYLALPPGLFATTVTTLGAVGLPAGSRIALEKPFGEDLASAIALNRLLARASGDTGEQAVFRIDHVLGMATVQNLLPLRLANRVVDAVWNGQHIEEVRVVWEETLALEGRAGYYDKTGALKDVMQNHMLQVLCLLAMEPPATLGERDLRDRKVDVLRSVRPLGPEEMASRTRRARYAAGRLGDRAVPAYADEDGVEAGRETETFGEVVLDLDSRRWAGTRFVLRAGKALGRRRKEAVVRFRPLARPPFDDGTAGRTVNELRIGLDGPEDLALALAGSAGGRPSRLVPLTLSARPPTAELPAYGRVLLDVLEGGSTLSIRGDEAEEAWRVMTPVLEAWAEGRVPLEEYAAGSSGPPPL